MQDHPPPAVPNDALLMQVGASNELPESEELDALYDRFLLRRRVEQVTAGALGDMLQGASQLNGQSLAAPEVASTIADITIAREAFDTVRSALAASYCMLVAVSFSCHWDRPDPVEAGRGPRCTVAYGAQPVIPCTCWLVLALQACMLVS